METSLYPENQPETISGELENLLDQSVPDTVGRGLRFANYIVDLILIYAISIVIVAFSSIYGTKPSQAEYYLIFYSSFLTYYAFTEAIFRRSFGKLCTGTIVIKSDASPLTFKDVLLRSLSRIVPFEPLSALVTPWHDKWTNTTVVKKAALYKKPTLY